MDKRTYSYEAMFIISQAVAIDLAGAVAHIRQIIEKAGGSIIAMKKWDERRFAYEIAKQKRGVYILVYFSAPGGGLAQIERSCSLSEQILRQLIIRADHLSVEEMKAADGQKELEIESRLRASQGQGHAQGQAQSAPSAPAHSVSTQPQTAAPAASPVAAAAGGE